MTDEAKGLVWTLFRTNKRKIELSERQFGLLESAHLFTLRGDPFPRIPLLTASWKERNEGLAQR